MITMSVAGFSRTVRSVFSGKSIPKNTPVEELALFYYSLLERREEVEARISELNLSFNDWHKLVCTSDGKDEISKCTHKLAGEKMVETASNHLERFEVWGLFRSNYKKKKLAATLYANLLGDIESLDQGIALAEKIKKMGHWTNNHLYASNPLFDKLLGLTTTFKERIALVNEFQACSEEDHIKRARALGEVAGNVGECRIALNWNGERDKELEADMTEKMKRCAKTFEDRLEVFERFPDDETFTGILKTVYGFDQAFQFLQIVHEQPERRGFLIDKAIEQIGNFDDGIKLIEIIKDSALVRLIVIKLHGMARGYDQWMQLANIAIKNSLSSSLVHYSLRNALDAANLDQAWKLLNKVDPDCSKSPWEEGGEKVLKKIKEMTTTEEELKKLRRHFPVGSKEWAEIMQKIVKLQS